ncbi:MAG: type II toxin-antitoxin system RelE/ParE family toxin [Aquisalinus sp.]|nr:type II toxin-antitoxin system RelE/ParE family toxin [Aquisalinus sp.]
MFRSLEVRLRPAARQDLEKIWLYSAETWSPEQADTYIRGLSEVFDMISAHPEIARERIEFSPPVRIHRALSHIIIYVVQRDHIEIVRIRHKSEDWLSDPSEETTT